MIAIRQARRSSSSRAGRRLIAGFLTLLGAGLPIEAAWSQQAGESLRLKDGSTIQGTVFKADLNVIAVRRAIGGVRLLPNSSIAELGLDSRNGESLVFRFDDWINGAASFERGGVVVAIEDWVESEAGQVDAAASPAAAATSDDDGGPPVLSVSAYSGEEGGRSARIRLELSKPASALTQLVYATSDGTATAGVDYEAMAGVIIFEPGKQSGEFEIPILDDEESEEVEFLKLLVNADPELVSIEDVDRILAVIRDND